MQRQSKIRKYAPNMLQLPKKPIYMQQITARIVYGRNSRFKSSPSPKQTPKKSSLRLNFQGTEKSNNEQSEIVKIIFKIEIPTNRQDIVKLALQSSSDLFFYYTIEFHESDIPGFNHKYQMEIKDLAELVLMFQNNIEQIQAKTKTVEFIVYEKNKLLMTVYKDINKKQFIVFELPYQKVDQEQARQNAALRYGLLRQQICQIQSRINDAKQTIKARNPYLLTYINKI